MSAAESRFAQAFNVIKDSRQRFISSVVVLLLACIVSFIFSDVILIFFKSLAPAGTNFVAFTLAANFETYVRVSLFAGIGLASPYLVFQLIRSMSPFLKPQQKIYLYTFIPMVALFFVLGIVYASYVFMPLALKFTIGFVTQIDANITPYVDIGAYVGFMTRIYLMIGLAFEIPVIAFILAKLGFISHTWLASKWRWGVLGSAIIAALVTPTGDVFHDSFKDLLLMDCGFSVSGPIFFLYFLSIFMAWLGRKPKPVLVEEYD